MNRFSHRLFCVAVVVALVLQLVPSGIARAQETAAFPDDQVQQRLSYIESVLKAGQPRAGTWYYGWIAAYTVGAAAGGILAGSHWTDRKEGTGGETVPDREFAEGMLVGGATFVLGVGALLVDPFTPATAARKLGRVPGNTAEERRAKLQQAEDLLRKCARREWAGRSLRTHLMNIGGNVAAGIVTKTVFKQSWTNALIAFASGEAVSLLNIYTQPMRATRDLKDYEAKYLGQKGGPALALQERKWTLSAWPGGLTFRLEF
jgi:hypothetical protein